MIIYVFCYSYVFCYDCKNLVDFNGSALPYVSFNKGECAKKNMKFSHILWRYYCHTILRKEHNH
ncbi:MAG: hypothetical protein KAQ92_02015, partial [Candidatus Aenigmarchaeota archaeon]|nr:hypothetical protein [Candidatus Aenigmarchaeota archaeon]